MMSALLGTAVDRFASTTHELVIERKSYRRRQKPSVDISTDRHHHDR